mgnify:CR=1 FL=1
MRLKRKTAPKVRNGQVIKKNNWALSPSLFHYYQSELIIERYKPSRGYRHLLRQEDIADFIELIPRWDELSRGLDGIVLSSDDCCLGWYKDGIIGISAWEREIQVNESTESFYLEHRETLDALHVPCFKKKNGDWKLLFTVETAKAFQLLRVFLHELGHHHDWMNSKKRRNCAGGEPYACSFEVEKAKEITEKYIAIKRL